MPCLYLGYMDSGYYTVCTGLVARTQQLDTIANNLANASTVGYRAQHDVFSSVLADARNPSPSPLNQAINNFGILSGTIVDQTQGALQRTGNPLDVAIEGSGYFVVQTPQGLRYTRNGGFQVSGKNQLVTASGDPVMGDKGVITVTPGSVSISADGTISTDGAITGKLRVVDFQAGVNVSSAGNGYYSAPAGTEQAATHSEVRQGLLESSNVNPVTGMVDLIGAQRSAEMMQRALSMFNSEIDKTATQDLPKVS